jgi:hypothetical protein
MLLVLGCSDGDDAPDPADAAPAAPDAPPLLAPSHLLIAEAYTQVASAEFVEIYNPTDAAIELDDYYLSDSGEYARLPANDFVIDQRDFLVRFPAGSSVAAGQLIVVAHHEVNFEAAYDVDADFAITGIADAGAMIGIALGAQPELSDIGEGVALFTWDGASDLVADIDLIITGIPQPNNDLADKTGVAIDGPDPDSTTSTYAPDAHTMPRFADVTTNLESYKRTAAEGRNENGSGGNGITGHDETSENTTETWSRAGAFTAPTPGTLDF